MIGNNVFFPAGGVELPSGGAEEIMSYPETLITLRKPTTKHTKVTKKNIG